MADQRVVLPGEQLSEDEVDSLLDGLGEDNNICQLEEIDPSQPGWEVILHFDNNRDPKMAGTEAAKDFWKLEEWSAIGFFTMEYQRLPNQ